jgi:NAD(P)H-hydrate epimerase
VRLLNAAECRALDALARERGGLSEHQLIERAGREAAVFIAERYGALRGKRIAVLCGKGHNAADGLVAARHLAASGADVALHLAFEAAALSPEAATALRSALAAGALLADADAALNAELIVDALVGTGARLPLQGPMARLVEAANASPAPVLALDLPSGLGADDGRVHAPCIRAEATLCFLAPKLGAKLAPGRDVAGAVFLAPLLDARSLAESLPGPAVRAFGLAQARQALPPRAFDRHKRQGEVLVIAGSHAYLGAALLCARGAYRAGAGLVRLALPEGLALSAMVALPEAVVVGLPAERALNSGHLKALLALAEGAQAVAVGPGLSRDPGALELAAQLWRRLPQAAVFDADALAADLSGTPGGPRLLTPHEGECRRLLGDDALDAGRLAAAMALANRFHAVALLKGPATLIAAPGLEIALCESGGPVLASAGSGDVLCGAVAALLAQGAEAFTSAALGAWIHGRSGERWAKKNAGRGLLASELADGLPAALAEAGA